jgi:uncharacterized protein YbjQ (UPF0145 family)
MVFCRTCGASIPDGSKFCPSCGATVVADATAQRAISTPSEVIVVTTPTVAGYRITRVLGIVTGLTPRTRGVGGKIIGGIQSALGGEVVAFTTEIEKAKTDTIERVKDQARNLGANAVVGLDMETADLLQTVIVVSATGTAVIVEKEA